MKTVLMVAAENDALPGAKVGGIGDVVRDLPKAVANEGCKVHVVIPAYGFLHALANTQHIAHFPVFFAGQVEHVDLYSIPLSSAKPGVYSDDQVQVCQWVLEHRGFSPMGVGKVYCNDPDDRPFASDASKYALFCAAVGQAILNRAFGDLDILHLHDWHAAMLAILRQYDPRYAMLKSVETVYSIHNLALQGVRPFRGDSSSLMAWFPALEYDSASICDPQIKHCVNPMRAAIVLADKIHAVSPTYSREIQRASHIEKFVYGGEGLEYDLVAAEHEGRLFGILNGCEYPEGETYKKLAKADLIKVFESQLLNWIASGEQLPSAHWIADKRISAWSARKKRGLVISSVGRLTEQKVRLLKLVVRYADKRQSVLAHLLDCLGDDGVLVFLGSGASDYEAFLRQISAEYSSLIFLNGYAESVSQALYSSGDLFLMPSSFEPCGISQMLAMRAGQPCLVHGVGGLNDTVKDGVNGFVFTGASGEEQALNFINKFTECLELMQHSAKQYKLVADAAAAERFTWQSVASEYLEKLY